MRVQFAPANQKPLGLHASDTFCGNKKPRQLFSLPGRGAISDYRLESTARYSKAGRAAGIGSIHT